MVVEVPFVTVRPVSGAQDALYHVYSFPTSLLALFSLLLFLSSLGSPGSLSPPAPPAPLPGSDSTMSCPITAGWTE